MAIADHMLGGGRGGGGGVESLSASRERLFDGGVVILVWGLGVWKWVLGG